MIRAVPKGHDKDMQPLIDLGLVESKVIDGEMHYRATDLALQFVKDNREQLAEILGKDAEILLKQLGFAGPEN